MWNKICARVEDVIIRVSYVRQFLGRVTWAEPRGQSHVGRAVEGMKGLKRILNTSKHYSRSSAKPHELSS